MEDQGSLPFFQEIAPVNPPFDKVDALVRVAAMVGACDSFGYQCCMVCTKRAEVKPWCDIVA